MGGGAKLLQLAGYLVGVAGVFAALAAGILVLVSGQLVFGGRVARRVRASSCAQVAAGASGDEPYRVSARTGSASRGPLRARLSGEPCAWYRLRAWRRYPTAVPRQDVDGWQQVPVTGEELAWEWDCGPFPVRDATGTALVAPALLARSTALRVKHQRDVSSLFEPLTTAVRQQGGGGPLSVSMAFHAVNDSLDRCCGPAGERFQPSGRSRRLYRVTRAKGVTWTGTRGSTSSCWPGRRRCRGPRTC